MGRSLAMLWRCSYGPCVRFVQRVRSVRILFRTVLWVLWVARNSQVRRCKRVWGFEHGGENLEKKKTGKKMESGGRTENQKQSPQKVPAMITVCIVPNFSSLHLGSNSLSCTQLMTLSFFQHARGLPLLLLQNKGAD